MHMECCNLPIWCNQLSKRSFLWIWFFFENIDKVSMILAQSISILKFFFLKNKENKMTSLLCCCIQAAWWKIMNYLLEALFYMMLWLHAVLKESSNSYLWSLYYETIEEWWISSYCIIVLSATIIYSFLH